MTRKRAPGAGRKPQGEFRGNSKAVTIRVRPEIPAALKRLAERHGRSMSQEIQRALDDWITRSQERKHHIRGLAHAVTLLARRVEHSTGKNWIDDPFTSDALRHGIDALVSHFAPAPGG